MKEHVRKAHNHRYWVGKKDKDKHLEIRHLDDMNIKGNKQKEKDGKIWVGTNAIEKNIRFCPDFLDIYTDRKISFKIGEFDEAMMYITNEYTKYLNEKWLRRLVKSNFTDHVDAYFGKDVNLEMIEGYIKYVMASFDRILQVAGFKTYIDDFTEE
jgi:hypothetical protein